MEDCHGDPVDTQLAFEASDQYYTLLGVRPDGVASVVDLVTADDLPTARTLAAALLCEHRSCHMVEVWRDGALIEQLARGIPDAL